MADSPIDRNKANRDPLGTRPETVREHWRSLSDEERKRRARVFGENSRERWASMTDDERSALQAKMAEGRNRSTTRVPNMARARYRKSGVPEAEIEYLLTLPQKERKWARKRQKMLGASPLEVAQMAERQGNACAICGEALGVRTHLDHDHVTGRVRGLLCGRCNLVLGHVESRGVGWLVKAVRYLNPTTESEAA